jgi:hypothetical protein
MYIQGGDQGLGAVGDVFELLASVPPTAGGTVEVLVLDGLDTGFLVIWMSLLAGPQQRGYTPAAIQDVISASGHLQCDELGSPSNFVYALTDFIGSLT